MTPPVPPAAPAPVPATSPRDVPAARPATNGRTAPTEEKQS